MTVAFDPTRASEIGAAGVHLVCADLLMGGYRAMMAAEGLPYDLIAERAGRLVRVTVKATIKPLPRPGRPGSRELYQFAVGRRKRDHHGKTTARAYSVDDVDIVALVALDLRTVGYIAMGECPTMVQIEAPHGAASVNQVRRLGVRRKFADLSFETAIAAWETSRG